MCSMTTYRFCGSFFGIDETPSADLFACRGRLALFALVAWHCPLSKRPFLGPLRARRNHRSFARGIESRKVRRRQHTALIEVRRASSSPFFIVPQGPRLRDPSRSGSEEVAEESLTVGSHRSLDVGVYDPVTIISTAAVFVTRVLHAKVRGWAWFNFWPFFLAAGATTATGQALGPDSWC